MADKSPYTAHKNIMVPGHYRYCPYVKKKVWNRAHIQSNAIKITDAKRKQIVRLRKKKHLTLRELAEQFGCTFQRISQILKENMGEGNA